MEVVSCKDCGRLYNHIGGVRLCVDCRAKLEDKFTEVKRYIEDHKNATVNEVSEIMEVSTKQINQWIREERLAFSEDSSIFFQCDSCGTNIRTGRFCDQCKSEMSRNLGGLYRKEGPKVSKDRRDPAKMRFLDN